MRYYFGFHDGTMHPDVEGVAFPDDASARREATKAASDLLRDRRHDLWSDREWSITVEDEQGRTVGTIQIKGLI